jgi:hypothetical protein
VTDQWIESLPARNVAMIHAFSPMLNRALLVGATLAIVVAILMTPFVADGLPSPFQPIVTAAVGALVGTLAAFLSFPARLRRSFEAYSWLGRTEMDRFVERTGGPVPVKPADIERWLSTTPSSPATRLARGEVIAFVGRYDDAKAEIQTVEGGSPEEAMELASLRQYIGWLEDGTVDLAELAAAAASVPAGSTARAMADVTIALAESRRGFVDRDPHWFVPLESVRASLGRAPAVVVARDTWLKFAAIFFIAALAASVLVLLLR